VLVLILTISVNVVTFRVELVKDTVNTLVSFLCAVIFALKFPALSCIHGKRLISISPASYVTYR